MIPFEFILLALIGVADADPPINPVPRAAIREPAAEWTFDAGSDGWTAEHHSTATATGGLLRIEASGDDPYLHRPVDMAGGDFVLEMRVRRENAGSGAVYWTTRKSPRRGEDKVRTIPLGPIGQWRECAVRFSAPGQLTDLRIDPGAGPGLVEIDFVRLVRERSSPLVIEKVEPGPKGVRFTVRNLGSEVVEFTGTGVGQKHRLEPRASLIIERPTRRDAPVEAVSLELQAPGFPPVRRTVFVYHSDVRADWLACPLGEFTLDVSRDGTAARIRRGEELAAVLAPLVHGDGVLPKLRLVDETTGLRFRGDAVELLISTAGDEISVSIESRQPCEGPVVRVLGGLEEGLLAGLEYLEKDERSSSKLDVETEAHLRYAPDPLLLTMPLMALATDRVSVAMTWSDMELQPSFATPNFFDGTEDHRMALGTPPPRDAVWHAQNGVMGVATGVTTPFAALRDVPHSDAPPRSGALLSATIRVSRSPLVENILWAVKKHGLPPVPPAPRSALEQRQLCLKALNGPLRNKDGWGHCVEDRWPRHPYADMASNLWRLTGQIPEMPRLVPGGSHIPSESIYFVSGRAQEWKDSHARQVEQLMGQQQADGSYHYRGEYARGHWEDTALGVCARPATLLLEYAHLTGDQTALEAGLKTLQYMKRFRVPRGAQVWEIPLHTPDILASAYAVWANVRGYELTGRREYLAEARRWALTGVPFVYLWGRYPVMAYGTPPVLGATNWRAPVWFGLPVQWCGLVYAYSLALLTPHDDSLDWRRLARGILVAGEQMQYPDGPYTGLLPDAFALRDQERRPWTISPCALVSLRTILDGQPDGLSVANDGKHRVAAPFPVTVRDGQFHIAAPVGSPYQVLLNGQAEWRRTE